jgi:hypothetical protein
MQAFKGKKVFANPKGNVWNWLKTRANISECGLKATGDGTWQFVYALEGYAITGEQCRKENFHFPGTIVPGLPKSRVFFQNISQNFALRQPSDTIQKANHFGNIANIFDIFKIF